MADTYEQLQEIEDQARELPRLFPALSTRYIHGEGSYTPGAFVVWGSPGAQEDQALRPAVGQAGTILRELMGMAGLFTTPSNSGPPHEPNAWLTYAVKFRHRGDKTPRYELMAASRDLLIKEWRAVGEPKLLIAVGAIALHMITKRGTLPTGKPYTYRTNGGYALTLMRMTDPAYGTRKPETQDSIEKEWEGLKKWRSRES